MRKSARLVSLIVLLASALPIQLSAQANDPRNGNWEINLAKSKFSPGPPPKGETRTYVVTANSIKSVQKSIDAEGKPGSFEYDAKFDGKDYPTSGSPNIDTISVKRVDAYTLEFTQKKNGKVVAVNQNVISRDGKVITLTSKGTNSKGQAVNNVVVLDKR